MSYLSNYDLSISNDYVEINGTYSMMTHDHIIYPSPHPNPVVKILAFPNFKKKNRKLHVNKGRRDKKKKKKKKKTC